MKTVFIGHRGTGKSELFKRLQLYIRDQAAEFFDLDSEIEKKIGKSIRELFLENGEEYFRNMERQVFLEMLQTPHSRRYLVLGAGFDLKVIPDDVHVLWVKRATDLDGRIFLHRPRLEPDLLPIEEFRLRASAREPSYLARADEVYLMPEGMLENRHHVMAVEKSILLHELTNVGGAVTILPEVMSLQSRWQTFKERFAKRGVAFFELRDDLLTDTQMQRAISELPEEKIIFSLRTARAKARDFLTSDFFKQMLTQATWVDLAWETTGLAGVREAIPQEKLILSLHEFSQFESWSHCESEVAHLKFSPQIVNFSELFKCHQWQQERPERRSFLPRSSEGHWDWYRLLQKERQMINFFREDGGSAGDQPPLALWLQAPKNAKSFAAVLGDPVRHSYTPIEHSDFFQQRNKPVVAIKISRHEWDEAFPVLEKLGLTHAAVTSPHKENAARIAKTDLSAINTLYRQGSEWIGTSTDDQGFLELIDGVGMIAPLQKEIFVWGGGGVLEMIQRHLPQATYFSSRVGLPRDVAVDQNLIEDIPRPKIVIWAAPRDNETKMPPADWLPAMVLDLNYKEDSLGKEYAQRCGANYVSGLVMFTAQAQGQRLYWRHAEEEK